MRKFFEIHNEVNGVLPFVLFSIGEDVRQSPIHRASGYEAHQFLWAHEGEGHFLIDGESFTLHEGEGVFFRANVPNRYEGVNFHTRWISFMLDTKVLDYLGVGNVLRFSVPATLDGYFFRLLLSAKGNSTVLSRSYMGYSFVIDLFSSILTPQKSAITRVIHLLEYRFAEPLTLDEIAEEVGMDRFSLCRRFAKETGNTVMNELLRIRIENAKQQLRFTNTPISRVGESCGFESAGYFGKRFRETVGCTPSEYRKQYGESVCEKDLISP